MSRLSSNAHSAKSFFLSAALPLLAAGCASSTGSGGTAAIHQDPYGVTGRDAGRGGATAGGLSSLDPTGNAQDISVQEAREKAASQR